jgi:hypothetical protein
MEVFYLKLQILQQTTATHVLVVPQAAGMELFVFGMAR